MKKTKLLAWAVVVAIGGLAMTSIATATTTVTPLTWVTVNYTLNEDLNTVFTAWVLEISWDDKKIFILDRNLWATTTWDLTSALPTSYWYYFQWWNNYWFSQNIITWNQKIDCSWYGPNNPLYNNVLISDYSNYDYCLSKNDNLWWNTTNTNEARRWPCPENFHIPTSEEVIIIQYNSFNGLPVLIPLAGYMSSYNGSVRLAGMHYYLWSSSPGQYSVYNLGSEPADIYRTSALPIRCVYNYNEFYENTSSEGGDSEIIVNIAEFNWWQNTCSGSNYIFENIVAWTSTGTHTLSWVFQCAFGNGRSSSTVTLQLSGDLVADGDRVISGSNLMMKNSEWTVSPVWLKFANTLISTWSALTATQTLFQKTANLIWVASWVVEVQLTVPWWTPDGTYNWVLVLTY